MSGQHIIMNFSVPPSMDDLQVMSAEILLALPHELLEYAKDLLLVVEDFPDEVVEQEMDVEDPYDLLALFRSGKEVSPGVERKSGDEDDQLTLYRRPILDLWCETSDDLFSVVRQVVIEEIGRCFNFSDDDVEVMVASHYQAAL